MNPLPNLYIESGKVPHPRRQTVAVINDDQIAVRRFALGINDCSVGRRMHLRAKQRGDIHAEMNLGRFLFKRIGSAAERAGDVSLYRPDRRRNPPD